MLAHRACKHRQNAGKPAIATGLLVVVKSDPVIPFLFVFSFICFLSHMSFTNLKRVKQKPNKNLRK
jgi:hypothetical protein